MAPVTEIALLPLVEGKYPDDANSGPGQTWKGLLDTLLSQKGVQKVYWGREIENPSTLRLFVDWDSLDGHKTFIASEYIHRGCIFPSPSRELTDVRGMSQGV